MSPEVIELIVLSLVYISCTMFLQRRFGNMGKIYENQKILKGKINELNAKTKAGASKEELAAMQNEINSMLMNNMKYQMKPMLIVAPVSLLVYFALLPWLFGAQSANVVVPLIHYTLTYRLFFIYISLVFGLIGTAVLTILQRRKANAKASVQQLGEQGARQV